MKIVLFFVASLLSLSLFAQEKGVTPLNTQNSKLNPEASSGQTYAVVVGISDYQDPGIPDLRFADKDAEAFAGFLQSPAGGSLDEDHLKVLLNKQATVAQFAIALDWLMEVATENDRVIIYFSGHGDVERRTLTQPGFLLCWDAPSRVYMAGGALALPMLQEVVSTLSIQNQAKVIVVADACRAGKLSGSKVGGAQLTNSNLAKQYANEIKILSCQPDEYSIEGEQWGGGRGAFSYHLLDGLYGMADRNGDASVNLMEIRGYLEEHVSMEVDPQSQLPMTVGNGKEKITDVSPDILEQLKEGKRGKMQLFTPTESRGIEDDVLAAADSNIVEMYLAFQESLADQNFLCDSTETCADFYYSILSREPQLEKLHSSMRRNYAAALQDDAQQVLNKLLHADPTEVNKKISELKKYAHYPDLLRRAAGLLGENHYMFRTLIARSYWFEGYINDGSSCYCKNIHNANIVLPYYFKALEYQPGMPQALIQIAAVYGIQKGNLDSAAHYANLVLEESPTYELVYSMMANIYLRSTQMEIERTTEYLSKAKEWLDRGLAIDSNAIILLLELGFWYSANGQFEKEQEVYDRALKQDSLHYILEYKGWGYFDWGKYEEALNAFEEAIQLDSSYWPNIPLWSVYHQMGQDAKAKEWLRQLIGMDLKINGYYDTHGIDCFPYYPEEGLEMLYKQIQIDSLNAHIYYSAARAHSYFKDMDYEEAIRLTKKAIELNPKNLLHHLNLGLILLRQNKFEEAKKLIRYPLSLDSTFMPSNVGLYMLYLHNDMVPAAENEIRKGVQSSSILDFSNSLYYTAVRYSPSPKTADLCFFKLEEMYPESYHVNFQFAQYLILNQKNVDAAFYQLEKAFQKGFNGYKGLKQSKEFRDLKLDKERWLALMKKYFPDQIKE